MTDASKGGEFVLDVLKLGIAGDEDAPSTGGDAISVMSLAACG